ncbi:hypothetical protein B0H99_101410 [Planomicrobium soli]|uniref:Uncharacterized protein n=1 Tax=Planomicrobium soli TaxID=1176648 RepID=A0A2P8H7G8_9BACL|nr:hypothetical protein [Planomicrobium soli]PSL42162.1 hypothetical protein B0H99_101410 [Planomicrobium soli]
MIIENGEFLHIYILIVMALVIGFGVGVQWGSLKNGNKKAN